MGGLLMHEKKKYAALLDIPNGYDDYWYFRKYWRKDLTVKKRLQYLDFHTYLPDDNLTKVDRTSMLVALECRVPFLSRKIIEFVFSLPENIIYRNTLMKGLMKSAYEEILPRDIIQKRKQGFAIPIPEWRGGLLKSRTPQEEILKQFKY
jgi:asparagine synthase (glutamine-hydrolysing)